MEAHCKILRFPRILILLLLISFATVVGLLVTPSLPQIAAHFAVSEMKAQWTMSIFLVGYALSQLPYGPIANRFGRKKAIGCGVFFALIGSLIAYFALSFEVFCLGRFLQAIGSGVGLKIAFTMVGDLQERESATKTIALLTLSFGLMPGLATAAGGYATTIWGWKGCFLLLIFYTLLLALLCATLPETAKQLQKEALQWKTISRGWLRQFKDPFIVLHAFLAGLCTSGLYIFSTLSPYISIQRIGLAPNEFGLWALIPSFGFVCGAFIARRLTGKGEIRIHILSGILVMLLGVATLSVCYINDWIVPASTFFPLFFFYLGANIVWSNAASKGLSQATDKSNASAVIQFINMGTATIAVFLIEGVPPTTTMLLPAALALLICLMFAVWFKLTPHHR